jgi:hypothetical protein
LLLQATKKNKPVTGISIFFINVTIYWFTNVQSGLLI